ncbi:hypothetical protein N3K66_004095 [Trichothecium roseum]|uniref:Uncharacterized protein n=1 Tax=Trichothecium roseum TaxID=47278 RepID=A0ACC0V1Y6_9HYPO|nr:hypothetical protein N3K66_004095 [Trichothecium roseum]
MDTAYLAQLPVDDANLIMQLLEEDGQQLINDTEGKGKLPEDTMTDAQLAADLLMNQLQMASTFLADVRMAKSLQDAVQDDEQVLADSRLDERIAENDRALCVALSNGEYDEPPLGPQILPEEKDDFFDKLSCIYVTGLANLLDEDFKPEADFATSVDEQLKQVLQVARDHGWQRCQNCWGMVELNTGCFHMTCLCGYQFCYLCGGKWKTCTCENWQERRLLEREGEIEETPGFIGQAGADDDALIL